MKAITKKQTKAKVEGLFEAMGIICRDYNEKVLKPAQFHNNKTLRQLNGITEGLHINCPQS